MKSVSAQQLLKDSIHRILAGRHHDPFDVLGCHRQGKQWCVRAFLPGAAEARVVIGAKQWPMERQPDTDFFTFKAAQKTMPEYQLRW